MINLFPFNQMKQLKGRVCKQLLEGLIQLQASGRSVNEAMKNERGAIDIIALLVFGAIVILAVFAGKAVIDGTFADFFDKLRTWINSKADQVFS